MSATAPAPAAGPASAARTQPPLLFSFFHLMAWPFLDRPPASWPVSPRYFDPHRGRQLYREYLDQMVLAEELGFDWVGCNEHHYTSYGLMASPTIIGGALTQRTQRARLAILGSLVPLNNPVRVAEEYAMLDVMSGGRLVAGFIRGLPQEYIAYHVDPEESFERLAEAWDLILRAWTEPEPFGWEGKYYRFRTVSIWPRPLQQPHPPIFISGGSSESVRLGVRRRVGIGVALANAEVARTQFERYRQLARADGWEPTRDLFFWDQAVYVAKTDAEARAAFRGPIDYFYRYLLVPTRRANELVVQGGYYRSEEDRQLRLRRVREREAVTLEAEIENGRVLCGSPDTVIEQLRHWVRYVGHGVLNLRFQVGTMPHEQVVASMRLFAAEVLPHVRDL
ncbi:MAG TPA: LLM class flavin-dependent oxidoreductase [Chloroflexota bacterium]|nr:LLM class flavin-dependent oxidoreductase [Chloroflexota bacterium]